MSDNKNENSKNENDYFSMTFVRSSYIKISFFAKKQYLENNIS